MSCVGRHSRVVRKTHSRSGLLCVLVFFLNIFLIILIFVHIVLKSAYKLLLVFRIFLVQ